MVYGGTKMSKKINIRPSTSVYATYKNLKYNPWSAIAEFVDNSTQSFYDNVKILESTKYWGGLDIEIAYKKDSVYGDQLVIIDNAYGMNFDDFKRAIILDSPPKKKNRSEFGMGLKTAACWFGLKWSVESTQLGSNIQYKAVVDVEQLHKYRNEEIVVEETEVNPKTHGTTITIWNLNRGISGRQIGKTKEQLSGIYRSDIRSNIINIYYNGEKLEYTDDPELVEELPNGTKKSWRKDVEFVVSHLGKDYKVNGWIAIKSKGSTSNAGFALMRFNRVIVGGFENHYRPEEVFEKSNSFVYQRLMGELNLDDWPVTQTKDAFDWYDGLEDSFIEQLKIVCAEYIQKAKDHRHEKITNIESEIKSAVDNFKRFGVIESSEVKSLDAPVQNCNQQIDIDTNLEELSVQNKSIINNEFHRGRKILFKSKSIEYIFNLKPQETNPEKQWLYISETSKDSNEYDIEWNLRHPFFSSHISNTAYYELMLNFIFALSLAEIETRKTMVNGLVEPSSIRLAMNDMFKNVMNQGDENE